MASSLQRFQQRLSLARRFARAGVGPWDRLQLSLAGLARQRPFGPDSLYGRVGQSVSQRLAPRVHLAKGLRIPLELHNTTETTIFEEIYLEGTYPLDAITFAPDLIVDCGAFSGMFTLLAHGNFPHARLVAFEPDRANHDRLCANIAVNSARVECHHAAVGVADGQMYFTGGGYGGKLVPAGTPDARRVRVVSLPRLLREAAPHRLVLKIDVEGAERELLPAIIDLLPPETVLFLETHFSHREVDALLAPLIARGFTHRVIRERQEDQTYIEHVLVRRAPPLRHYCTYFDLDHASLGLSLLASLRRQGGTFLLWVLCLDDETHALLQRLNLPDVRAVRLAELEDFDPALLATKSNRSRVEYIFTCTPCLPRFLLARHPEINLITYLDADLWFTYSPEVLFDEFGDGAIAIVPHRFPADLAHLEENGRYNVGWLSFRRDVDALKCLEWWRERCLEWCYLRHEDGRYADQKYLDDWPTRFRRVTVLQHRGANLGLWNLRAVAIRVESAPRGILVEGQPLVFFHFHGLRRPRLGLFCLNSQFYRTRLSQELSEQLLQVYADEVRAIEESHNIAPRIGGRIDAPIGGEDDLFARSRFLLHAAYHILRGNFIRARKSSPPF